MRSREARLYFLFVPEKGEPPPPPEYLHALTDGQKQEILAYIGCQAWTLQDSISMWYGDQVKGVFAS